MFSKFLTFVMAIYYFLFPLVPPSTENPIKALDEANVKLTFAALADSQVSNYLLDREPPLHEASDDIKNAKTTVDALLIAGDITENGIESEYNLVTEDIIDTNVKNFIMATGNHDIRFGRYSENKERFVNFQNNLNQSANSDLVIDKLHYSYEINGYTFVVMGSDRTEFEEAYFNDEQLVWLDETLKAKATGDKPVFVVIHQAFKETHGLPDTWGSPFPRRGTMGEQNDQVRAILNKYENIIMISGHLHTGFGQYTYEKIDNFDSVNLPSVGIENKDGDYNNNGIGFMVEVYDKEVVFRARNFAKGEYLPDYDIKIDIE